MIQSSTYNVLKGKWVGPLRSVRAGINAYRNAYIIFESLLS